MTTALTPPGTGPKDHKPHDEHVITAVLIGVILIGMVIALLGIFLWKRRKRTAAVDPHWAGRSPFADGDLPDVTADGEPAAHGLKRASVLSLLPWKFNKNTQLLENIEGQLTESKQNLDDASQHGTEESNNQLTDNSANASMQTSVSDEPISLPDVLSPPGDPLPEPLDLPPPPNWLSGVDEDLASNEAGPLALESKAESPPALSPQNPGDTSSPLPPSPDALF